LWHVFNMRDNRAQAFRNEITRNRFMWGALVFSSALIAIAVLVPGLSKVLSLALPDLTGWLVVAGFSIFPLVTGQAAKFLAGRAKWG